MRMGKNVTSKHHGVILTTRIKGLNIHMLGEKSWKHKEIYTTILFTKI